MTGKEGKNTRRSQGVRAGRNSMAIQLANMNEKAKEAAEQIKRLGEIKAYKQEWRGFKNFNHAFDFKHMEDFFNEIISDLRVLEREGYPILKYKGGKEIFNIPCSFDIETSSFYDNYNEKAAIMYIWQFGFNGSVIYGRTWDEFFEFIQRLVSELSLSSKRFIYIYVHNLMYEFQFIRYYFEWDKVFALKKRKVLYCRYNDMGLEFRCSYILANASLAHVGDKLLTRYKVKKLVGNLDYSKIRHSKTLITRRELDYCLNDVRVVMAFIQEKIENDIGIDSIPLTNTGYVRNFSRNRCMADKHSAQKYHALMRSLTIETEEEYDQNKAAFMGGFTHTNLMHANKIKRNVGSADLTSSYPAEIVASYMPMTSSKFVGEPESEQDFLEYLDNYCCIFDIKFKNLRPSVEFENYLSLSRCIVTNPIVNNGRLVSADECITTLTELDYDIVNKMYDWDTAEVTNLRIYNRGYLPKSIILAVLELYGSKTKLKDVPDEVVEYLRSKNMVNASFGMMVTDIIRPEYHLDENDLWVAEEAFKAKQLDAYNKNFNRFLYYTWGIYVTAHARHNLFEAILEFGEDYIYADTDSIKGLNFDKHMDFFRAYNYKNKLRMQKMCETMDIPFEKVCPKTVKGDEKLLGVWEIEKSYKYFKACGAKRYMFMHDDNTLSLTVSGLNKRVAVPYLINAYYRGEEDLNITETAEGSGEFRIAPGHTDLLLQIMKDFQDGFTVPKGHTGKSTLTYIDGMKKGVVTDYLGVEAEYLEASAIHMEPQGFQMSQTEDYLKLLEGYEQSELR